MLFFHSTNQHFHTLVYSAGYIYNLFFSGLLVNLYYIRDFTAQDLTDLVNMFQLNVLILPHSR